MARARPCVATKFLFLARKQNLQKVLGRSRPAEGMGKRAAKAAAAPPQPKKANAGAKRNTNTAAAGADAVEPFPAIPVKIEPGAARGALPTGEGARMLANLKFRAKQTDRGKQELEAYQGLSTTGKRAFYWDNWILANPEGQKNKAAKINESTREQKQKKKEYGWVEKEFVAKQKGLAAFKTDDEEAAKLDYHLNQCAQKPHPAADKLPDKDAKLYWYVELLDVDTEKAVEGARLDAETELDNSSYDTVLANLGQPTKKHRRKDAAENQGRPRMEDWMKAFKKEGLGYWNTQKSGCDNQLKQVEDVLLDLDLSPDLVKKHPKKKLWEAYQEDLREKLEVLKAALRENTSWKLRKGDTPGNESEAKVWHAEYKHRGEDLKRHKDAFIKTTSAKLTLFWFTGIFFVSIPGNALVISSTPSQHKDGAQAATAAAKSLGRLLVSPADGMTAKTPEEGIQNQLNSRSRERKAHALHVSYSAVATHTLSQMQTHTHCIRLAVNPSCCSSSFASPAVHARSR